jgi:hypothetical protein
MTDLPHDEYMAAVARALHAEDIEPAEWWTDQEDDRLDAVFRWDDAAPRAEHWPHGVYLGWDQHTGWNMIEAGGSRAVHALPDCRTYGDPQQIAATVHARLVHGPDGWTPGPICRTGDLWDVRPTVAAVERWDTAA